MAVGGPLEKFAKLPTKSKVAAMAGVVVALTGAYYALFYMSLAQEFDSVAAQRRALEEEKRQYEVKRQDYHSFRNEVQRLIEEQKELLKILPRKDEIPGFLEAIHSQAALVGVDVLLFERRDEEPLDFYAKIPVAMQVTGPYHRVAKFFRNVGALKRIVNIEDLAFAKGVVKDGQTTLKAAFTASTFRFLDKGGGG